MLLLGSLGGIPKEANIIDNIHAGQYVGECSSAKVSDYSRVDSWFLNIRSLSLSKCRSDEVTARSMVFNRIVEHG